MCLKNLHDPPDKPCCSPEGEIHSWISVTFNWHTSLRLITHELHRYDTHHERAPDEAHYIFVQHPIMRTDRPGTLICSSSYARQFVEWDLFLHGMPISVGFSLFLCVKCHKIILILELMLHHTKLLFKFWSNKWTVHLCELHVLAEKHEVLIIIYIIQ